MGDLGHDRQEIRQPGSWPHFLSLATLLVALASLVAPLGSAGLWDPPELEAAELSRRIAVNLLGGEGLRLDHAVNAVPIRRELGRGELPFTSMALGLRYLGLSDWAARAPLALWALLGAAATYALTLRLSDRRTAALSTMVLCVSPLYFVQARFLAGDIELMAALSMAVAGLGIALFDERPSIRLRLAWGALGLAGLYSGLWCRGLLCGVAVPLIATTFALFAGGPSRVAARGRTLALVLPAFTIAVLVAGTWALFRARAGGGYSVLVGFQATLMEPPPAFDGVVKNLGHALFPMSALLPFALALLLRRAPVESIEAERERRLRLLVFATVVAAIAIHSSILPLTPPVPFSGVFACAIAIGLMLRDADHSATNLRFVAYGAVAVLLVLAFDFRERPETVFASFEPFSTQFPASLRQRHQWIWSTAALVTALSILLLCVPLPKADSNGVRPVLARGAWWKDWCEYLATLRSAFAGNLWFALVALFVALTTWAWTFIASEYVFGWGWFRGMWSLMQSVAVHAWWVLPALVLGVPLLLLGLRDAVQWLLTPRESGPLSRISVRRSGLLAGGLVCVGLALSLDYFPRLTAELSPKRVFQVFAKKVRPGDALGLLGISSSSAAYYTPAKARFLATPAEASRWLDAGGVRRFLVTRASDLPELNASYRRRTQPPRNLPVLAGGRAEVALVASSLNGQANENPFITMLMNAPPPLQHHLDANLADRLDVVGWQIRGPDGAPAAFLVPGTQYELSLVYEVLGRFVDEWETFVHIDGRGRRFNADHATLGGQYPMQWLNPGDVIVDRHDMTLDPNFTPGEYRLYFGMYRGKQRLPVRRGAHDNDRVEAGTVVIR